MTTLWNKLTKFTVLRWWLLAVLSFWLATVLFVLADFVGARWFGVNWLNGPDLFPNAVLGYSLALFQILAAVFLVASGVRLASNHKGLKGMALGAALVVVTGSVSFIAYALFALWYHIDLMKRPI